MTRKGKRRENKRKNDVSLGADWIFRQKVYGITKNNNNAKSVRFVDKSSPLT
jgi:hypothetical protein